MIVLDASGSMNTRDAPGSRIDAAKSAVSALVRQLPASAQVGLIVFGSRTGSSAADKAAGCRDIRTLEPVGPVHKAAFLSAVKSVVAKGYTPIGRALEQAAHGLPSGQAGSIVLVSDGLDTCGPPSPCHVAAKLKAANVNLVVHTVGFKVDKAARSALSCIADATGGTYRDAANGAQLGPTLQSQVEAGLRPYDVAGKPVDGSPSPTGAPLVAPGQYADTVAAGGARTKYYAIDLVRTETVYITSTIIPATLRGGGITGRLIVLMRLQDSTGRRCLSPDRADEPLLAGKVDPVSALVSGAVGGPKWSRRCPTSGRFIVAVTRQSSSTVATRAEVIVRLEPPVAAAGPPGITVVPPGLTAPKAGKAIAAVGGTSFNNAALVSTGTYRDTLSTGETRYYRVNLGWGQRLAYRITVHKIAGLDHGVGFIRSAMATPMRQNLVLSNSSNSARGFGGPASIDVVGSTLVPIVYRNRSTSRSDIRPYSLAGDYYLTLGMSYPVGALPYSTEVTVTVRVVGVVQSGPRYLPLPAVKPATTSAAPTPTTAAPSPSSVSPSADASTGHSGSKVWVLILAVAVLVLAAAAFTVLRRRRTHPIG